MIEAISILSGKYNLRLFTLWSMSQDGQTKIFCIFQILGDIGRYDQISDPPQTLGGEELQIWESV